MNRLESGCSQYLTMAESIETESHARSLAKALSWRVIALVITTSISYMLSESVAVAVSIGLIDSLIKIGAYYGHERAWMNIRFGKVKPLGA